MTPGDRRAAQTTETSAPRPQGHRARPRCLLRVKEVLHGSHRLRRASGDRHHRAFGLREVDLHQAVNRIAEVDPRRRGSRAGDPLRRLDVYARDVDPVELRRRVGMVFQKSNPFPKSIFDNVAYGLRMHGIRHATADRAAVEESLRQAALWDEVKDRLQQAALELSGGQQQRLCIARALAVQAGGGADGRAVLRRSIPSPRARSKS